MEHIRFEVNEGIAAVTLDRADTRNALSADITDGLARAVREVRQTPELRVLIIAGAGGHFCSGGDLRGIGGAALDAQGWRGRLQHQHEWLRDLLTLDKPVIAAVDGAAYGAGFGLALAADFVLATPRARFCCAFMRVGLVPDYGLFYTLPRCVGPQRAKELMLSAREVGAQEALRLGLALELHAPEQLLARAHALATSFVQASPLAVSLTKRALAAQNDLATRLELEADAQALAMSSQHHKNAVQHFLAKRPPSFRWPAAQ